MTISYTTPVQPTFHTITVPSPLGITPPDLPSSSVSVTSYNKDKATLKLQAFQYERFGDLTQNTIDGKIEDALSYTGGDAIEIKFGILKEKIMGAAQDESESILTNNAMRGYPMLAGAAKRRVYDIDILARKRLSEEAIKLLEEQINVSQESLEFAMQAGLEKEAALFDHHHKIQMLTLDAAVQVCKNTHEIYAQNVRAFNLEMQEFEQHVKNHKLQYDGRIAEWEEHLGNLDSAKEQEKNNVRALEMYKAGILLTDIQNQVALAELKLKEVEAKEQKSSILLYHAELKEYIAGIETIHNSYKDYRIDVESAIKYKNDYLKRLDVTRAEIRDALRQLDEEKAEARQALSAAAKEVSGFKSDISAIDATLRNSKLAAANNKTEFGTAMYDRVDSLKNTVDAAINDFETTLSENESSAREDIGKARDTDRFDAQNYRTVANGLKQGYFNTFKGACREETAKLRAASSMSLTVNQETTTATA